MRVHHDRGSGSPLGGDDVPLASLKKGKHQNDAPPPRGGGGGRGGGAPPPPPGRNWGGGKGPPRRVRGADQGRDPLGPALPPHRSGNRTRQVHASNGTGSRVRRSQEVSGLRQASLPAPWPLPSPSGPGFRSGLGSWVLGSSLHLSNSMAPMSAAKGNGLKPVSASTLIGEAAGNRYVSQGGRIVYHESFHGCQSGVSGSIGAVSPPPSPKS